MNLFHSSSAVAAGRCYIVISLITSLCLLSAGCGSGGGGSSVAIAPEASFTATPTSGDFDLTVAFTDTSIGDIDTRLWDFGDGDTSTEQNPSHTYTAAGEYTVTLTATGSAGEDTFVCDSCIVVTAPAPVADFLANPTSGTYDLVVDFTDSSTGPIDSRLWDFGDGSTSTESNPSHTYTIAGTFTVSLTVTGPGGIDTMVCASCIEVEDPPPTAGFDIDPTSGIHDLLVSFTDASTGVITMRQWDFGDGGSSLEQNPTHLYTEAGLYTVTLIVTGPGGTDTMVCSSCITVLDPPPVADFDVSPTSGGGPLTVQFTDQSTEAIDARQWDFGDPDSGAENTSSIATPSHIYEQLGTYTVTLTVSGPGGDDTAVCSVCIIVTDEDAPEILDMPGDMTLPNDGGSCQAEATWSEPTATDDYGLASLTSDYNPGDGFPVGSTTVTYTAIDLAGNSSSSSFTITIEDTEAPALAGLPSDMILANDAGSCSAVHLWDLPTASDNCAGVSLTGDHASGESFALGMTTVTYTATDSSGNEISASFTITVEDAEAPLLTGLPEDITLENETGSCSAAASWTEPTASDNCPAMTLTSDHSSGDSFLVGMTIVTYTATDSSGNTAAGFFTVTVNDTEAPWIMGLPPELNLDNDPGSCSAIATWASPLTTDNCGGATMSSDYSPGDNFPVGTTLVTYTSLDTNGNTTTESLLVTVSDTEAPTISGTPLDMMLDNDSGLCSAIATFGEPSASDNCAVSDISGDHSSGDSFPVGTSTVTYMATDSSGNTSMSSFTVTVNDIDAPMISQMPASVTLDNDPGTCGAVHAWGDPLASDNCDVNLLSSDHDSGDSFPVGTTVVTYTATDSSGNSNSLAFEVTVNDIDAPSISGMPADMTLDTDAGSCSALASWVDPQGNDNCGAVDLSSDHANGTGFPLGTTIVTYTALDSSGNSAMLSFSITVEDTEDPMISGLPGDLILENDSGMCSAIASWSEPMANDNCGGATLSSDHASGDGFDLGISTVTYTATDSNGNSSMASFTVTINDTEAPVISGLPAGLVFDNDLGACSAVVGWVEPTAADNCVVMSLGGDHASGSEFLLGDTTVTYTATDASGNISTSSFNISVLDVEPPVISGMPDALELTTAPGTCSAMGSWSEPLASDNCSGVAFGSDFGSGDSFPLGMTTVTYTAMDDNGNSSSASFMVTVLDEEAPSISGMPVDLMLENDTGSCDAMATWGDPLASDNCGGATLTADHLSGDTFPVGMTTVTFTATDGSGNDSMSSFMITVSDTESPMISDMPDDLTVTADSGQDTAVATWSDPLVDDNCQLASLTSDYLSGDIFPVGTTLVTYTATDDAGNMATDSFNITVNDPPPVADFTATPLTGTYNLSVNFIDTSIGPITDWLWDFGDGGTSIVQSPTHVYTLEGDYTVTLIVSGPGGSGSMSCPACIHVEVPPDYVLELTSGMVMEGDLGSFSILLDNNGSEIQAWSFGVCHDSSALTCTEVLDGSSLGVLNNGSPPDFNIVQIHADGFTTGVVISFTSSFSLMPGFDYELNVATYQADAVGSTALDFCNTLGTPTIGTVVVVNSQSIAPVQISGTVEVIPSD
ncbi:MAG: HYR domain-containing protein [Planctomycetes bacterium]|nr:HYR domain-containing protein [Planctomycetota bacterium]